jgi:CubicO group peptidase (beta-lactamase class C family)
MKSNNLQLLFKTLFLSLIFQFTNVPGILAQSETDKLDELLNLYTEYGQFNGSVLVAHKGEVVYKKGFGMANMEWDIPNESDTKHRLGSITKQFTSMLIMQMVEKGQLKLDVPITTYLPDYPKANGDSITLHHLLTHTSGIPNYTSFPNFFNEKSRNHYEVNDFLKEFSSLELEFTPGEKFAYSNSGYFLLGAIIEKVSGKTYEAMLIENITIPAKMTNTGYDHHATILKNRATGYQKFGDDYVNSPYLDMSIPYAAGSLYASADDLYLWDQALINGTLLSKEYTDIMLTPYAPSWGGHYAYGWGVSKTLLEKATDSVMVYSHGGGINGFNTLITRIPSEQNVIVLLNNTGGAALNEMSTAITAIIYNLPYELPKRSLANTVLATIKETGIESGLLQFDSLKDSSEYNIDEGEMNRAGYNLLQAEKVKEAIEIFKLNVTSFPKSSNAYDSLGEAYAKDGNKELAIKNYKKSVELNPKNVAGAKILEELEKN